MARRVRTSFKKLHQKRPRLYQALSDTKGMTSSGAYRRLTRKRIKPLTPLVKIRKMAKLASKRAGVPIVITQDMHGCKHADGVAVKEKGKVSARLHPVLKYQDKRYIEDVIGHELDHAKVLKRQKN